MSFLGTFIYTTFVPVNILYRGIISNAWAIDYNYATSMLPFLAKLMNGENVTNEQKFEGSTLSFETRANGNGASTTGQVAVINIAGPILKNDQFCGPVGTSTIGKWIQDADNNGDVTGIVLKIDSPGGSVDGTESLASIIKSTKKPVVAFVDGMAASAAYWIASAADDIIANGKTSFVGSVGTFITINDFSEALTKLGVKQHAIYATDSTDKNGEYNAVISTGDTKPMVKMLDKLNNVFTSTVTSNRGEKINLEKENVLTGKVYTSQEAKKYGLIDSIGTFADALHAAANTTYPNKKRKNMSKAILAIPILQAHLNWAEFVNNNGAHLQESELETVEGALVQAATDATLVTEQATTIAANTATITDLQTQLTAANNTISTLQAKVKELGAADAGSTTLEADATAEGDTKTKKQWQPIDDGSQAILDSVKASSMRKA